MSFESLYRIQMRFGRFRDGKQRGMNFAYPNQMGLGALNRKTN